MLHHVDDAADVEQVLDRRLAVTGARIDHVDGGAGRAEVASACPRARGRGADPARAARNAAPPSPACPRRAPPGTAAGRCSLSVQPAPGQVLDTALAARRPGRPRPAAARPCGGSARCRRSQRLVAPAFHARAHRAQVVGQGRRALRPAGIAPGRTASRGRDVSHVPLRRFAASGRTRARGTPARLAQMPGQTPKELSTNREKLVRARRTTSRRPPPGRTRLKLRTGHRASRSPAPEVAMTVPQSSRRVAAHGRRAALRDRTLHRRRARAAAASGASRSSIRPPAEPLCEVAAGDATRRRHRRRERAARLPAGTLASHGAARSPRRPESARRR